jgi:hypothetical protein
MNAIAWWNNFARVRFSVINVLLSLLWRTSMVVLILVLLAFAVATAGIDIALSVTLTQEQTEGRRHMGYRIGVELAELDPNRGLEILTIAWISLTDDETKEGLLRAFAHADHPRILDILNLGAQDFSQPVRSTALRFLHRYSIFDFRGDPDAYERWWAEFTNVSKEEVRQGSARRAVEKLRNAKVAERRRLLNEFIGGDANAEQIYRRLVSAGFLSLLEDWLGDPTFENDNLGTLVFAVRNWPPPESYLRRVLLPKIAANRDELERKTALHFLESPEHKWVVDFLLKTLMSESDPKMVRYIGKTLDGIGDPRAIPYLIGIIDADNSYTEGPDDTIYRVGHFCLTNLTGVNFSRFHDGPWWRRWWEENKSNFPEEARAIPIPDLPKTAQARNYVPFPKTWIRLKALSAISRECSKKAIPICECLGPSHRNWPTARTRARYLSSLVLSMSTIHIPALPTPFMEWTTSACIT